MHLHDSLADGEGELERTFRESVVCGVEDEVGEDGGTEDGLEGEALSVPVGRLAGILEDVEDLVIRKLVSSGSRRGKGVGRDGPFA